MNKEFYIPRFYGLSWDTKTCSVVMSFPKDVVAEIRLALEDPSKVIRGILERSSVELGEIGIFGVNGFGIKKQFVKTKESKTHIEYSWKIQPIFVQTEEKCHYCHGSKKDSFQSGIACRECNGTGKQFTDDPNKLLISGIKTFSILYYVSLSKSKTLSLPVTPNQKLSDRQLVLVYLTTERSGMSYGIDAWIDGGVYDFMMANLGKEKIIAPIERAMKEASDAADLGNTNPREFRISVSGENFWLNVPGNACSLGIDDIDGMNSYGFNKETSESAGVRLTPHNVDSIVSQVSFIAGLAKLHELVESSEGK